ncbi:TonB-dependent receptor domain-containing protein [Dyella humi]|uniref:TonB-dependent receptor n=1 Tax=Dyella humi TaxID=1770547 RepID=A0ABW8INP2_9GAMM
MKTGNTFNYSLLALACAAALASTSGFAQNNQSNSNVSSPKKLEAVTVTGSLIPQTQIETFTPTTTITSQELKSRGFSSVADALQQMTFSTGSIQNSQTTNSFTPGAKTLSLFGLPVGYVKYLIDGRPMSSFSALYNSTDVFTNLNTIPTDLVDHIDILPGGQSTLYGSDAIAGVVNIVMKKKVDAPVIDVRYGWDQQGGGANRHISFADGFSFGKLNLMVGAQFENTQPVWSKDRSMTSHFFESGTSPATASRDYLVYNSDTGRYLMADPNRCALTTGQFNGTEGLRNRDRFGEYCGSFYSPGQSTLSNGSKTANVYTHATFDVNDNVQLYSDVMLNFDREKYSPGSSVLWWGTSSKYGEFYDPNLDTTVNLQKAFSPEEVGGFQNIMYKTYERNYTFTFGVKGALGASNWDYDAFAMHAEDKLNEMNFARFSEPMEAFFANRVLGPNLSSGPDEYTFNPNYAAFYTPISNADFRSFTGYTSTNSKTWQNTGRVTLTNPSLFQMPGGDAGVAFLLEGGNEGWDYAPDARLLSGDVWGTSAVQGAGHRSRYAMATEWRLPLLSQLTLSASARYDAFNVAGSTVSKPTYNVGLEYRPFDMLLLRARYGTSFKAPTLADEFQGLSSYYATPTDYYNCAKLGYSAAEAPIRCPTQYNGAFVRAEQSGNPDLKPISSTNWSAGLVFSPVSRMALSMDFYHWNIKDEVNIQDTNQLLLQEAACRLGELDINSPTCAAAINQVTRNAKGEITEIYTPKVNVSNETLDAISAGFNYTFGIGSFGEINTNLGYTNILQHKQQQYAGDPYIDLLRNPYYSTDFKTKLNASLTWKRDDWSATLYATRYGKSPNYLASIDVATPYQKPAEGTLPAWVIYNASVSYSPIPNLKLSAVVDNLLNTMPPRDNSYPGTLSAPYNQENYNVFGRTFFLEANYKFGK